MRDVAVQQLPPEAYWSEDWYRREQEQLFARCWNLVATEEDVPPGRGLTLEVAGRPVVLWRSSPGSVPEARCGEERAACDTWCGLVFVHLRPDSAPPLASWLGDFPDRIGGFRPDLLTEVATYSFEFDANWKFFVENHVDVYHLWYLHQESLGVYDHHRAEWEMVGPHWVFYEPPRAGVDVVSESFWRGLRPIEHVGADRWGSGAHLIFPNTTLATGAGFFMTYQCTPLGPERSRVDLRVRTEPGSQPDAMVELSRTVIEAEDATVCVALQQAVRSPWFGVGPLARTHELPVVCFQEELLGLVEQ